MATTVNSVQQVQMYFNGVIQRAGHHGQNVDEVIYPLLGLILAKADQSQGINVRTYNGNPTNELWAVINGTKYAFIYDHSAQSIEIHKDSHKGMLVSSVNNATSISTLIQTFSGL